MPAKRVVFFLILAMVAAKTGFAEDDQETVKNCSISSVITEIPFVNSFFAGAFNSTPCAADDYQRASELPGEIIETSTSSDDSIEELSKNIPTTGSYTFSWYPMEWTWYAVLQIILAILGVVGNFLVILVIFGRISSSSRSTDILVGNLALVDLVTSLLMIPTPVVRSFPSTWAGYWYCLIIEVDTVMWTTISVSTYTLVAISFDRYFAIVHPLQFRRLVTRGRVVKCITLIWIFAFLLSLRNFFTHRILSDTGSCRLALSKEDETAFASFTVCLNLLFPVLLLLVTQMSIACALHRQSKRFAQDLHSRPSVHQRARNNVLSMMFVVIIVFIICWTPSQVLFLCLKLHVIPSKYKRSLQLPFIILAFFNSCLNPIIYTARNPQFRVALMDLLTCAKKGRGPVFEHDGNTEDTNDTVVTMATDNA